MSWNCDNPLFVCQKIRKNIYKLPFLHFPYDEHERAYTVNTVNCYAQSCLPPRLGIYLLQAQGLQDWGMNQRQAADECWKMEEESKSEVEIESRYLARFNRMSKNEELASLTGEPFSGRESRRTLIISFIADRVQGIRVS